MNKTRFTESQAFGVTPLHEQYFATPPSFITQERFM
ncbi:Uncharacterised protein [Serratia fonticola]|jgi:hypothetical protein|uniref:Uncharacterized protein n=1 Tax=Serratia fonticola TaxID=47917 RepID=A0A4V6KV23_SERFO|nr:Uncharacterised protein [Serratia fonticola]VTR56618.1 Uncharacterised protein [Serratia fonticola]